MSLILCAGLSKRSGTNYMGSIFSEISSVDSVPKDTSKGEFPFFPDKCYYTYDHWVKKFNSTFFADPKFTNQEFAPYFGNAFLEFLRKKYQLKQKQVFVKNPSLNNIEHFYDFFPNGKLIILTRSAPDLLASTLKATLLIRKSQPFKKKIYAYLKYYTGYNMYLFSKAYVADTQRLLKIREELKGNFLEVKYEDLVNTPEASIQQILDYCGLSYKNAEFKQAANAKVVGSSFYGSNKYKQNWEKIEKTKDFNPIGRYKNWHWLNRLIYNWVVDESNKKIGYTHKV